MASPLLELPGAVAAVGRDADVAAHYGGLYTEQRALVSGVGFVDLSHRDVFQVSGPERLTWLHNLTTQHFLNLAPGSWVSALILSPQGHIEHMFEGVDDGENFVAHTEPGAADALVEFLGKMKFRTQAEVTVLHDQAVMWRPSSEPRGKYDWVPIDQLATYADAAGPPGGLWAFEAMRIARGEPRLGRDTDHKTIPNEVGLLDTAVQLTKGCYRGQETVARVHNLGRPPRRLAMAHLDGSENKLPAAGGEVLVAGKNVGFVGSSARHYELGPIALVLIKRNVPIGADLEVAGMPATQHVIVDPEVGLHFRAPRT
jgi:tRNA-modifying protein YgfZ